MFSTSFEKLFHLQYAIKSILLLLTLLFVGAGCSIQRPEKIGDGGVFYSEDRGSKWEQRAVSKPASTNVVSVDGIGVAHLQFEPGSENTLYFAGRGEGVTDLYRSTNKGKGWTRLGFGAAANDFAIDQTDPNVLYATAGRQIYKSIDRGKKWTVIFEESSGDALLFVEIDPRDDSHLLVLSQGGTLLESTDYGQSWAVRYALNKTVSLFALPPDRMTHMVVVSGQTLWLSENGGETFDEAPDALKNVEGLSVRPKNIAAIQFLPNDPSTMYVADTKLGLLLSKDFGQTFREIPTLLSEKGENVSALLVHPRDPNLIFFAVRNIIHRTTNGGATWTTIDDFPSSRVISVFLAESEDTAVIYAGVRPPAKTKNPYFPYL